jgi:dihydroflavonol-4-reductase
MKVLVTGANGFLGSWVVRRLLADKVEVHILRRQTADLSELAGLNFVDHIGDVTDLPSLLSSSRDMTAVFHLAGVVGYSHAMRAAMEKVNVQGTQLVVEACRRNKVARLIHLSSVTAIGAGLKKTDVLNENSPYNISRLDLGYFETKRKGELIVKDACKAGDLDAVILNPSTVYGAGDARKGSRKTQLKVARGELPFYTSGGVSIADVECVAEAIVEAWRVGRNGERYILGGENISIKELFTMIASEAGVKPPSIGLPRPAIFALGAIGDLMENFGMKGPLNSENAWTSVLYHWFDSSKAKKELNYKVLPAREAIAKSVAWMKENGLLKK